MIVPTAQNARAVAKRWRGSFALGAWGLGGASLQWRSQVERLLCDRAKFAFSQVAVTALGQAVDDYSADRLPVFRCQLVRVFFWPAWRMRRSDVGDRLYREALASASLCPGAMLSDDCASVARRTERWRSRPLIVSGLRR